MSNNENKTSATNGESAMKKYIAAWKVGVGIAACVLALSLPTTVKADQILTFEGFAPYTILTTQYAGINFGGSEILQKPDSLNWQNFPPHSGVNVIYNPSGPMSLTFATPINYFSGYVTYNDYMTIQAFDASNNLLGTVNGAYYANYVATGNPPNELLTITDPGIVRVVLTGGGGDNFTLDDVEFSNSRSNNVPDGGTTATLLGIAIAGLAAVRRKLS